MQPLFPALQHYAIYDLPVGDSHTIHVREYGDQQGIPVVFFHGGPGSGCNPDHARFFNPDNYRIVLFDQRGCGLSTPSGDINNNTTWDLVDDLEILRTHLGIQQWLLFAGSWGATLALVYAQTHPDRVTGLILRGVFLARQIDIDWFFSEAGVARIFPQAWNDFSSLHSGPAGGDLISAYYDYLMGSDSRAASQAARAWTAWGDTVVTNAASDTGKQSKESVSDAILAKVRIETHYARHRYFLEENYLIDHCGQLPDVPIIILHGRHDLVCLPESAYTLHRALPGSQLKMTDSGHLATETNMIDAIINTTEAFAGQDARQGDG